jgi:hypothetical protein
VAAGLAVLIATIGLLAAFLVPFVLLGRAGYDSLGLSGATDRDRGYSLVLPVLTALTHVGLLVVVWVVAIVRKSARERS